MKKPGRLLGSARALFFFGRFAAAGVDQNFAFTPVDQTTPNSR
jgi:hypothetical protein